VQLHKSRGFKRKREASNEAEPEAKRVRTAWAEGIELLGDLAPENANWTYPLLDQEWRCFAGYLKEALTPEERGRCFELVRRGTTWLQPSGRWGPLPLKTAWMCAEEFKTCKYRYGGAEVLPVAFPNWMQEVMATCMPLCGLLDPSQWPNSCNLNLYVDGQHSVGWHADNEDLFQGKFQDCRIISLSLGQTRKFELKCGKDFHRLDLGDGDLCTMEGMTQKHYQHRVPKEFDKKLGERINLTWRWIVKHGDCASSEQPQRDEVKQFSDGTSSKASHGLGRGHGGRGGRGRGYG